MIRIYLDSSAFLKRFNEEPGSEIIMEVFEKCEMGKITVVISQWTINETIVAFDKLTRMSKGVNFNEINYKIIEAISWIENRKREGNVELVKINDELISNSIAFIRFNHLSADDAMHAYCAIMGMTNVLLMDDSRFSYWLKTQMSSQKRRKIQDQNTHTTLSIFQNLKMSKS